MATIVQLPRLSDTMEEGAIAKWHIAPGDKVKRGQVIAEIETDKATMDFESFDSGVVLELVASEGQTLPIGSPIAVFGQPGEDAKAALAKGGGAAKAEPKPKDDAKAETEPKPKDDAKADAKPKDDAKTEPEANAQPTAAAPSSGKSNGAARTQNGRVPASPLARRIAHENGVALDAISGSGPHGRVVKTDVEKAVAAKGTTAPTARPALDGPQRPDQPIVLSQMRKAIARRMSQANAEIPHFYLGIVVDMDNVVAMREQLGAALPDAKISFNDFVVLACARALVAHPDINAYWNGETIVHRGEVHVGIAVAVEDGLVVPVIKNTDRRTLREIAAMARDLGMRARTKKLAPPEMSGSTFSVSNLGMFGIETFAAVVNPGEGAILAVGSILDEAVVKNGALAVGKRMRITLSCDHRVMDGASAARFLGTLRQFLEQPLAMLA